MRNFLSSTLLVVLCGVSIHAHADTLSTFSADGVTFRGGGTATGNVIIDVTNGIVQSGSFLFVNSVISSTHDLLINQVNGSSGGDPAYFNIQDSAGNDLLFAIPALSFVGYGGGLLAFGTSYYPAGSLFANDGFGKLDLVSSVETGGGAGGNTSMTPEPSSFVLLGTGLLGLVGVVRKRFA